MSTKAKKGAADAAPVVYVVAPGKSISSARGVLEPGTVIDFLDDTRTAEFVAAGYLVAQAAPEAEKPSE